MAINQFGNVAIWHYANNTPAINQRNITHWHYIKIVMLQNIITIMEKYNVTIRICNRHANMQIRLLQRVWLHGNISNMAATLDVQNGIMALQQYVITKEQNGVWQCRICKTVRLDMWQMAILEHVQQYSNSGMDKQLQNNNMRKWPCAQMC